MTDATDQVLALARALGGQPAPCQTTGCADLWFDPDPETAVEACGRCHGRVECEALAVALGEKFGVWGGRLFDRTRQSGRVAS